MESTLRRTWAEIDLDALGHNYRALRAQMGPASGFLGVVKADSYGHGAVHISRELEALGAEYLAISSVDEAQELRRGGVDQERRDPGGVERAGGGGLLPGGGSGRRPDAGPYQAGHGHVPAGLPVRRGPL